MACPSSGLMRSGLALLTVAVAILALPTVGALFGEDPLVEVPEPRAGDVGVYEVLDPVSSSSEDSNASIAFEVGPKETREDAYLREQPMWPVSFAPDPVVPSGDDGDSGWLPHTTWLSGTGGEPGMTDLWTGSAFRDTWSNGPLAEEEAASTMTHKASYAREGTALAGPSCLLTSGFVGMTLDEKTRVDEITVCGEPLLEHMGGQAWNATGEVQEVEGEPAQAWVTLTGHTEEAAAQVDLAFRDGLAYPVEIHLATEMPEDLPPLPPMLEALEHLARGASGERGIPADESATAHLELTRFGPGEGPVVPPAKNPAWPEVSTLEQAGTDRWGPADGGDTVPYPYREAVHWIQEDPTMWEFHAWLEENEDARVTDAEYMEHHSREDQRFRWSLSFMAPDGDYRVVYSSMRADPTGGALPEEATLARVDNSHSGQPTTTVARAGGCQGMNVSLPDEAATLSALVTLWHEKVANEASGDRPNRISWRASACSETIEASVGWSRPVGGSLDESFSEDEGEFVEGHLRATGEGILDSVALYEGSWSRETHVSLEETSKVDAGPGGGDEDGSPARGQALPLVGGAAATGLIGVLLAVAFKLGWVPFYSRIEDEDLVDHPVRRRLLETLREDPGLRLSELARGMTQDRSTVRYHLSKLEEADFVEHVGANGSSRWFVKGQLPPGDLEAQAVLATGRSSEVYEAIKASPGASLTQIGEELEMHPSSVHRVVERLLEAGLVEKDREGRSVSLRPAA